MTINMSRIIIHCSDSNFGDVGLISKWHEERGFKTVGYHYVIMNGHLTAGSSYEKGLDGLLQEGRPLDMTGAHTIGYNKCSVGICLIGRTLFSLDQLMCLLKLIGMLRTVFPEIAVKRIQGHNEFSKGKTCPNFNVENVRQLITAFKPFGD